jgi:hypothetical protein
MNLIVGKETDCAPALEQGTKEPGYGRTPRGTVAVGGGGSSEQFLLPVRRELSLCGARHPFSDAAWSWCRAGADAVPARERMLGGARHIHT